MLVEGIHSIRAPRDRVWASLNDPLILARCVPGVKVLEPDGEDKYRAQIELAVGGMDFGHLDATAAGKLDADGARLTDDMEAGGDEAVGGDDKTRADAVLLSVASVVSNDDDGIADGGGELLDGVGVGACDRFAG